jgi:hypothetical protein
MTLNLKYLKTIFLLFLLIFSFQSFAQNKAIEKVEKIILNVNIKKDIEGDLYGDYLGRCGEYEIAITKAGFFSEYTADDFSLNHWKPERRGRFILKKNGDPDFDLTDHFFNNFKADMAGVACLVYADKKINPILLMWTATGGNMPGISNIARFQRIDLKTKKITKLGEDSKQISKSLGFDFKVLDKSYLK